MTRKFLKASREDKRLAKSS